MKIWKPVVEYIGFSFYYEIEKGGNFLFLGKVPPDPFKNPLNGKTCGALPLHPTSPVSTLLRKATFGGSGIFPTTL